MPLLKPFLFLIRAVSFTTLIILTSLSVHFFQYPSLLLLLHSHRLFRLYNRRLQQIWASLIIVLTWLFAPVEVVVGGEVGALFKEERAVVIANHQIYTDWWYLWCLAHQSGWAHGDVRIILKESLKWMPIFGLGMRFFEFIYLKRKWSYDKKTLLKSLTHTRKTTLPLWLIIFPEGTVITADTKSKSLSYAKKADIPDRPELVLIPKTTGLFFCAKTLQPSVDALFDVTIAYSGLGREECPYDEYPLTKVFWGGEGPRRVYMHVRKYKVSELPGFTKNEPQRTGERERTHIREDGKTKEAEDEEETEKRLEAFGLWLRKLFMEKDEMMKQFHESGGKILGPPSTTTRSVAANGNGHASHSHEYRHEVDGHASTNGVTVANGETVRADVDTDKDRKVFRIKPKLLDIVNVVGVNLAFGVLWVFIVGWILRWWVPK